MAPARSITRRPAGPVVRVRRATLCSAIALVSAGAIARVATASRPSRSPLAADVAAVAQPPPLVVDIPSLHRAAPRPRVLVAKRNVFEARSFPRQTHARRAHVTAAPTPWTAAAAGSTQSRPDLLRLIGVGADPGAAGVIRLAIVTDGQHALYLVREGERIGDHYMVMAISDTAVDLRDIGTHAICHLSFDRARSVDPEKP